METWVDLFWNSSIQIILFSFLATAVLQGGNTSQAQYMVVGMIFWNMIWVNQYAMALGILWETWSRSFSSLFVSPLTMNEFLFAQMLSGCIKSFAALGMSLAIAAVIHGISLSPLGFWFFLYCIELMMLGWSFGFLVLSLILRFGTDVQSLSWAIVFAIQPIGGIFFPAQYLPESIRWASSLLPTTYIFSSLHGQLEGKPLHSTDIIIATILNSFYFFGSYLLFRYQFHTSRITGRFARMES
jgi:ABC-2 type transport system permease protein